MKSIKLSILLLLCVASSMGQQNDVVNKLVLAGIELHDKGDYAAAIKKYDEALLIDKDDYNANYEKSFSCLYDKRVDECIAISKYLLKRHGDNADIKSVYSNYGSALDDAGKAEEAIIIFDQGIKKNPTYYLLHFNKGLTLARQKKWDDASISFLLALQNKPNHPGSLYYMALLQENSNKVAAVLSCMSFLAVETEGKRAEAVLKYLQGLMGSFAKKDTEGGSVITIDAGDLNNPKKENNFSMVQMMLAITNSSGLADSVNAKSDVEKFSLQIQMMATALSTGKKEGSGIYWKTYAPFFIEMKEKEWMPVFAHLAFITSGNQENIKWINDNPDKLKAYYKWFDAYQWIKEK